MFCEDKVLLRNIKFAYYLKDSDLGLQIQKSNTEHVEKMLKKNPRSSHFEIRPQPI